MTDAKAIRALRAMRARRFKLAQFANSARWEYFRADDRLDYVGDYWYLDDWLDVRERISGAWEDRARLAEDEQRAPPTVICPVTPGTFDNCTIPPWENFLSRAQRRERRQRNGTTKMRVNT